MLDQLGDPSFVISLVLFAAVIILFLRYTRRSSKASAERIRNLKKPPEQMTLPAHNLDAPTDMARAEVQMHELSRDMLGQLDTRIAVLNSLLRRADEQIARLQAVLGGGDGDEEEGQLDAIKPSPSGAPPIPPFSIHDPKAKEIYALADAGHTSASIAQRVGYPVGEVDLMLRLRPRG